MWILWYIIFSSRTFEDTYIRTVHEENKDYKCEFCGKPFSQAGHLKGHIHTIHEDHIDHKCESCGKSFSHAGSLKKHVHTVHEGHKDFECESCNKSSSYAAYLYQSCSWMPNELQMWLLWKIIYCNTIFKEAHLNCS